MTDPPALTAQQMREVDRLATEEFGIDLLQMMENAGRSLAELAIRLHDPGRITVLAGSGGNGGGGLVAARHLANRNRAVTVVLTSDRLSEATLHQLRILQATGIEAVDDPSEADLVLDAILGYSLEGNPRGRAAQLIDWANRQPAPVLALDLPSGLDPTTGREGTPCIRATQTLTLALPKRGLARAPEVTGDVYLADISLPSLLYARMGIEVPPDLFNGGWVVSV